MHGIIMSLQQKLMEFALMPTSYDCEDDEWVVRSKCNTSCNIICECF